MELIDILDENGQRVGITKSKEKVHEDGDWHRAVHVWIVNLNNEVLLQRRAKTKINHPDMWDISVAGHISAGEDSISSALREIEEEIGLTLKKEDLKHIGELKSSSVQNEGTYINNEINDVYLVRRDLTVNNLTKQDSEVDDLTFISLDEFKGWINDKNPELVFHEKEFELFLNSI
ncbi:MAG: NUDIX domain-containing protein [Candidatus Paceibacterota bacterium]